MTKIEAELKIQELKSYPIGWLPDTPNAREVLEIIQEWMIEALEIINNAQ